MAAGAATIKDKVSFTKEEEKLIEYGNDVKIWFEIQDITQEISAEEKKVIDELIEENAEAIYLDVSLFKQVGKESITELTKLNKKTQITLSLPEILINKDQSIERVYKIIHMHNDEIEIIIPTFDAKENTLTFEADTFSTYTITYTDTNTGTTTNNGTTPNTGDSENVILWIALMVLSVLH